MSNFRYVKPGDPPPRSAAAHNRFVDAARANARTQPASEFQTRPHSLPFDQNTQIRVVNTSGVALERYAICYLSAFTFSPTTDAIGEETTTNEPIANIGWPATDTHRGRWVILTEPVDIDGVASAVCSGVTIAKVEASAVVGDAVDIDEASGHNLDNALDVVDGGIATIMLCAAGFGLDAAYQWAVIRIGGGGGGGSGPAMVEFQLEEVCCDTLTATATVTRILCSGGSGVELGDLIELIDSRQCHLIGANPEPSMWLGIKGVAIKMEFNISDYPAYSYVCDDLAPITGNNDCKWSILDLCNNGNFCS